MAEIAATKSHDAVPQDEKDLHEKFMREALAMVGKLNLFKGPIKQFFFSLYFRITRLSDF